MRDTKATPGKWKVVGHSVVDQGSMEIARVSSVIQDGQREANAKLIADAPDLLEICAALGRWGEAIVRHGVVSEQSSFAEWATRARAFARRNGR